MKFKNIIFLTGILLPVSSAFGQYAEDALRFSQTDHGATSRFRGMGSAQTALGGDISSVSSNPAGLGLFTKSEFSFTPQYVNSNQSSEYFGTSSNAKFDKAGISQLGIVFHLPAVKYGKADAKKGRLSTNIALSYNKTNNFNNVVGYRGNNGQNSFADYVANTANDYYLGNGDPENDDDALPAGSLEQMAYNNFLIEYNPDGYFATTGVNPGTVNQDNTVFHTGSQSEFNLGIGTNYNNQLYIGATISLASINYGADREFIESGKTRNYANQPANFVNAGYSLNFRSIQETSGTGINGKLGIIYRAAPFFRLGASLMTPTWYSISDEYSEELETRYAPANGNYIAPYTNDQQTYPTEYELRTPYRANIGGAITINSRALITGDVEYVDYASIRYNSSDMIVDNRMKRDIRDMYKSATNYRFGLEAKVIPMVPVRIGYNIQGNPYKQKEYKANTFTAGIGYRVNNLSFDLAYTSLVINDNIGPYKITEDYPDFNFTGSGPRANVENTFNNLFATIGIRF